VISSHNVVRYCLLTLVFLFAIPAKSNEQLTTSRGSLGLHIHRPLQAPWPEFSFSAWRLLDAGVSWRSLQPDRQTFDFNRLDLWVNIAKQKKVEVTYVFYATPVWASARPTEAGANGAGSAAEPSDLEDWRRYVRTVATRYKGRIQYYEVWNEPNWKNFYTGNWTQLATLVREASTIIREVDPDAKIILPGLASELGLSVIDDFLDTGVGRDVDIIGYHFYTGHRPPEVLIDMVTRLRTSLARSGLGDKPIWNTEFGWLVAAKHRPVDASAVGFSKTDPIYSDEVAASFVIRAHALLASLGIERSYFYAWDNDSMGVFDQRSKEIKPSLNRAFEKINRWFTAPSGHCKVSGGIYICPIGGTETKRAVTWSVGPRLDRNVLTSDWQTAEDIEGNVSNLKASAWTLPGTGPYLLGK
jgi:hypothetical protein